jgi:xylulose-5-phosphate/fructose-6-phosphate phosphoketolase
MNKKADVIRVYLPPDANTLLSVADHCLRSRNYVNVIVAGKQMQDQWLDMASAERHCTAGIGKWEWASNDGGGLPDAVMACAGDVPTLETLAAVTILRRLLPDLRLRVVNVVDLMTLQPHSEHPHGLDDDAFDDLFTTDRPIVFAYHGYPWLIHRLTYRRHNHDNLHVRGYKEEGTTTTPFDMTVLNDLDRFHLARDVIRRVGLVTSAADSAVQWLEEKLREHRRYVAANGQDLPEVRNWTWRVEPRTFSASTAAHPPSRSRSMPAESASACSHAVKPAASGGGTPFSNGARRRSLSARATTPLRCAASRS